MTVRVPNTLRPSETGPLRNQDNSTTKISAFEAKQTVAHFVIVEISTQLLANAPELLDGQRLRWSVPVHFTTPNFGIVGKVGEIMVDATTGELLVDEDSVQRMTENAQRLANSSSL